MGATARMLGSGVLLLLLAPAVAWGHGLTGRADLPVPLGTFYIGAAAALVVSFVVLGAGWRRPLLDRDAWRPLPRLSRLVMPPSLLWWAAAAAVLLLYIAVVASPFLAPPDAIATDVMAPVYVFVLFWVGMPIVSAVIGDIWRGLHPLGTVARLAQLPDYRPDRKVPHGIWIANAGILLVVWLELIYPTASKLTAFGTLLIAYTLVTLVGMWRFGWQEWLDSADPFCVYTRTFASLSAFETRTVDDQPVLGVRRPVFDAARLPTTAGTVALLGLLIGTVSFDGFSATGWFDQRMVGWRQALIDRGMDVETWTMVIRSAWLVGFVVAAAGLFWILGEASGRIGRLASQSGEHAAAFAHTLVPIALAYVIAHYFSYLMFQGQLGWFLLSDPFGVGWNLFGAADSRIDYAVVGAETIWYVQVGAIVVGHVVALALAHDRALQLAPGRPGDALRSQLPMLVLMLIFTLAGMWFLSEGLQ